MLPRKRYDPKQRGTYEEAVAAFEAIGWTPLFNPSDYLGVSKKLTAFCRCGAVVQVTLNKLSKHGNCVYCRRKNVANSLQLVTKDRVFRSIGEAARHYGINHGSLVSRLRMGWTHDEACGLKPRKIDTASRDPERPGFVYKIRNKLNGLVYVGLTSVSVAARWKGHLKAARSNSTSPLHCAIREFGKDAFEIACICSARIADLPELEHLAIEKYKSDKSKFGYNACPGGGLGGPMYGHEVVYKRKTYISRREFAEAIGVNYDLVRKLFRDGLAPSAVAKEGLRRSARGYHMQKEIKVHGRIYPSILQACKELRLSTARVRSRLSLGWTIDAAFSDGVFTRATSPTSAGESITFNGNVYASVGEACRELGLKHPTVLRRLGLGWPLELALSPGRFTRGTSPHTGMDRLC